jgi:hypothetical protein
MLTLALFLLVIMLDIALQVSKVSLCDHQQQHGGTPQPGCVCRPMVLSAAAAAVPSNTAQGQNGHVTLHDRVVVYGLLALLWFIVVGQRRVACLYKCQHAPHHRGSNNEGWGASALGTCTTCNKHMHDNCRQACACWKGRTKELPV